MQTPLFLFGLGAWLFFGTANFLGKTPLNAIGIYRTMVVRDSIILLLFLAALAFTPVDWQLWPVLIAFGVGIIQSFATSNFFEGLRTGNPGIVSAISNSYVFLTLALSALVFNEGLSAGQLAAGAASGIGVLLLIFPKKPGERISAAKGAGRAVITMLCWAFMFALFVWPSKTIGVIPTVALMETGYLATTLITIRAKGGFDRPLEPEKKKHLLTAGAVGILVGSALFCLVGGLRTGQTGYMSVFTSASPLLTVILARAFYKDKLQTSQAVGLFITMTALALLYFL